MNLSSDNLHLLQKMNLAKMNITKSLEQHKLTPKSLLKELLELSVALDAGIGHELQQINAQVNTNISKLLLHRVNAPEKNSKKFKIPQGCCEAIIKVEQLKDDSQKGVLPKPVESNSDNKCFKKQEGRIIQKEKSLDGFVTANLLQKPQKQKQTQLSNTNSSLSNGASSLRKKFVPPFKKQDPFIQDQQQEKCDFKDPRYKNLDPKLVSSIQSQILESGSATKWVDIAGLGFAKKTIHEMIVWPMLRPDIFVGLRAPPKGVLLFGPPGTGKTLIGKAIASESGSTFFNISASSLTSKWIGQGEKLVKTLFTVALVKQPSVIFIDEIDSLLCSRSQNEQQSSRRMKTQFLVQLDGAKSNANQRILIIGATNRPNELDEAVRRRFVKRLYIPLPNKSGREELFKRISNQEGFQLNEDDIVEIASLTKGYSGADLHNLCSEASLIPLRKIDIKNIGNNQVPLTGIDDLKQGLQFVKSTVNAEQLKVYEQWNKQFGSYQLDPSMDLNS